MKIRILFLFVLLLPAVLFSFGSSCDSKGNGRTESANEGTISNPVELTVGTAHSGQIGAYGTSYYKFTANNDGSHTISLTNTQSDLSWDLFSDSEYRITIRWCDDFIDTVGDEIDTASGLSSGTTYYILVDEWLGTAGTFTLTIKVEVIHTGACIGTGGPFGDRCREEFYEDECKDFDDMQVNGADWNWYRGESCNDHGFSVECSEGIFTKPGDC